MTQSPGQGNALDNLLTESRTFPPSDEFAAQTNAQPALYEEANRTIMEFLPGLPYVHTAPHRPFQRTNGVGVGNEIGAVDVDRLLRRDEGDDVEQLRRRRPFARRLHHHLRQARAARRHQLRFHAAAVAEPHHDEQEDDAHREELQQALERSQQAVDRATEVRQSREHVPGRGLRGAGLGTAQGIRGQDPRRNQRLDQLAQRRGGHVDDAAEVGRLLTAYTRTLLTP